MGITTPKYVFERYVDTACVLTQADSGVRLPSMPDGHQRRIPGEEESQSLHNLDQVSIQYVQLIFLKFIFMYFTGYKQATTGPMTLSPF